MSKLFWVLLAAARGGYRYLRAVLSMAAAGISSRLSKAPGSGGAVKLGQDTAMDAGMVSLPVADGKLDAGAGEAGLLGRMVAWLVSVAYPKFLAGIALLTTRMVPTSGSGMRKDGHTEAKLTGAMDDSPGSPGAFPSERQDAVDAGAVTAPPVSVDGALEMDPALTAGSGTAAPAHGAALLEDGQDLSAGAMPGSPLEIRTAVAAVCALKAHAMTWAVPDRLVGNVLYIRQVYETQRDGDTLILR